MIKYFTFILAALTFIIVLFMSFEEQKEPVCSCTKEVYPQIIKIDTLRVGDECYIYKTEQ